MALLGSSGQNRHGASSAAVATWNTACVIPPNLPAANFSDLVVAKVPTAVLPNYLSTTVGLYRYGGLK